MTTATINVRATDVSGQKEARAPQVPLNASVGELVDGLLAGMDIPAMDSAGRQVLYSAYVGGERLHATDQVGDVLRENDLVHLQPNIDAGRMVSCAAARA